jgi:integrase
VVTLNGKDIYLGKWNTSASKAEYNRLIGEWLVGGRTLPHAQEVDLTVAELSLRYWRFAKGYYVKNGRPTGWQVHIRLVLRMLKETYGPTRAADFGPLALKAFRQRLIDAGHSRKYINKLTAILPRLFKWGVAEELLPSSVYESLRAVEGLRKGRTTAPETKPVLPVADAVVDATLPHLPPIVADMLRLQRYTGCRPGEVCILRPCDVDLTGEVWAYRPESHKTEHHGRHRVIFLGPKAQEVLRPYLLREQTDYCFVPAESERTRHARQRAERKSPMTPSQAKRKPKRRPKRSPGTRYATDSYRRAITRAVDLANRQIKKEAAEMGIDRPDLLPNWHPNQLRHSVGTEVRKQFGLEATQVVLGHASANVSEIYAERDMTLAAEIMRKIG